MTAKISKTMGEHLVKALANGNHEVVGARTNTERAMIGRGLIRHQQLKTRVTDSRGHLVRSHGCVLTEEGMSEALRLREAQQAPSAPQASSKHADAHDAMFYGTDGRFRADRSEQAWMSAQDNANQTAREEGFERGTEPWFKIVTSSYASLLDDGMYTEPTPAAEEGFDGATIVAGAQYAARTWGATEHQEVPRSAPQVAPVTDEFTSMGAAVEFLGRLKAGDRVRITREGRTRDYTVSMPARRSGSQSTVKVTVTLGPGRYAFEVSAGDLFAQRGDKATMTFGGTKMMRTPEAPAPTTTQEDTMPETPVHNPYDPTPGIDADGRPYAVGDTVESVHRARTGARRGMAAEEGAVTGMVDGRPVVRFTTGDQDETDVRPDLFRITTPAAPSAAPGQQYGGITREDVANGNGPAPALARAATFFRMYDQRHPAPAEERAGKFVMPIIDYRHRPHIDIDGTLYTVIALRPAGATADPGTVTVTDGTNGRFPYSAGTNPFETAAHEGRRVAWRVDGHDWAEFKGYQVRTEDRGHGIVAVYVKGSANDIKAIERASRAYARKHLTFAPGMSGGPVSGGGEFCDGGATYISQDVHVTQPLAPRED
ncbi:hypothetical protein OG497_37845 [Streptomyces sp. NBC_01242]|uniref:hypothetical protein n=1 Tax=Streptomyces sp. NBC_01242 TaxID=2903795 RepID=UPI00225993A4|nr:hypothetical protein [Streptomyces sp. NBC_01242]MCX4799622.1 hypothetical protein [Streptomyces sp. NBC_01242]